MYDTLDFTTVYYACRACGHVFGHPDHDAPLECEACHNQHSLVGPFADPDLEDAADAPRTHDLT